MTGSGTAIYKPGDLVLVSFPFSDRSQVKVRVDAIAAIEKSLILKRIGRINKATLNKVKGLLRAFFAI